MEVYDQLVSSEKMKQLGTAVALGMFDGVHLGHQQVICTAAQYRDQHQVCVLTFTTKQHRPDKKAYQKDILTPTARLQRIATLPVDVVCMPDFDAMREMSPDDFVRKILKKQLNAKVVCCGNDFRFGKNAQGDVSRLQELCLQEQILLKIVPPVLDHGEAVSSTRIRRCLMDGDIPSVNRLLGYCYFIEGEVVYGKQIGREIGCPTLNQELDSCICLPRFGVYISSTEIDGKDYPSITNVGIKPTIEGDRQPLAETHVIGIERQMYGRIIRVKLHQFIRDEAKFGNLEELSGRIHRDIGEAQNFFIDHPIHLIDKKLKI
jgi:riboflavin kinase/FMN adenylyltransferase